MSKPEYTTPTSAAPDHVVTELVKQYGAGPAVKGILEGQEVMLVPLDRSHPAYRQGGSQNQAPEPRQVRHLDDVVSVPVQPSFMFNGVEDYDSIIYPDEWRAASLRDQMAKLQPDEGTPLVSEAAQRHKRRARLATRGLLFGTTGLIAAGLYYHFSSDKTPGSIDQSGGATTSSEQHIYADSLVQSKKFGTASVNAQASVDIGIATNLASALPLPNQPKVAFKPNQEPSAALSSSVSFTLSPHDATNSRAIIATLKDNHYVVDRSALDIVSTFDTVSPASSCPATPACVDSLSSTQNVPAGPMPATSAHPTPDVIPPAAASALDALLQTNGANYASYTTGVLAQLEDAALKRIQTNDEAALERYADNEMVGVMEDQAVKAGVTLDTTQPVQFIHQYNDLSQTFEAQNPAAVVVQSGANKSSFMLETSSLQITVALGAAEDTTAPQSSGTPAAASGTPQPATSTPAVAPTPTGTTAGVTP